MKIAHAPYLIGGHVSELSLAERKLGYNSKTYSLFPDPYGFKSDVNLGSNSIKGELSRINLLTELSDNADVIHFNFGSSCLPQQAAFPTNITPLNLIKWSYLSIFGKFELRDLKYLDKRGKKIIVTFQGDDARQLTPEINPLAFSEAGYYSRDSNSKKSKRIKIWEEFASHIFVLNPDLPRYFSRSVEFLPYSTSAAAPLKSEKFNLNIGSTKKTIRFAHAPSHFGIKGTRFIQEAVKRLQSRGHQVELVLISGKSNMDTQELISKCDYLIDQLLLGWYGMVAVEAMKIGVPVISFIDRDSESNIGEEMYSEMPIINANVNTIESVLENIMHYDKKYYESLVQFGISFVNKWHNSEKIAIKTTSEYMK